MLCNGENPILKIFTVERMCWGEDYCNVKPRKYSALTFRIKGSAVISTDTGEHYVHAGEILYIPQNFGYTVKYTETDLIVIHFETERDDKEIEVYSFENSEEIYKMFLQLNFTWENKDIGYTVNSLAQMYAILGKILEKETITTLPERFLSAVSYINANYKNSDLSIETVCNESNISPTMFRQLFKKHYQKTPIEYIIGLRIEHARNLISSGVSIESAAFDSGFNDPKYFTRVVKKYFGCTPRAFKVHGR